MDDRIIQFRVGIVVVAAALLCGILLLWFGEGVKSQYAIYLKYPTAPGVTPDTPVRKNGVLIGRVSDVELLDDGGVLLTAMIDNGRVLRNSESPRLGTASLLGDAVIEFVPKDRTQMPPRIQTYQSGDTITDGIVETSPLDVMSVVINLEDDMRGALRSVDQAGKQVAAVADNLNAIMGDRRQLKDMVDKTDSALTGLNTAVTNLNKIVGDEELATKLKKSLDEFPELVTDARQTLKVTQEAMQGFQDVSKKANENLDNLERFTKPLSERGGAIVDNIERSMKNVDELLAQLVQLVEAMNDRRGSLGKLVYDDELYNRLNRAAGNVEGVTRKLNPILQDVRVFTDKIATDPRQLGIPGVLDRRPLGTGLKPSPVTRSQWDREFSP